MKLELGRRIRYLLCSAIALVPVWLLAACGTPTATPEVSGIQTRQAEPTVSAAPPAASTPPQTGGESHDGSIVDQGVLIDTLRKSYPGIMPVDTINQPFMSVPGTNLRLADEPFPVVQVYEYTDEAAAKKDASKIQPNGDITGYHVGWIAQPHFYQAGRIIVIYLGKDPAILSALEAVVGKPFAVGEDVPSPGVPKP